MSIGSRIKERRIKLGLTQPELAELLDVSKGTVGNYECDISAPNEKILYKLFDILKCDANYLYQDNIPINDSNTATPDEISKIKKYRVLDEHGKNTVDSVLELEYKRMQEKPDISLKVGYIIKLAEIGASAGIGNWVDDCNFEEIEVEDVPEARMADFAVRIDGDSMEPDYRDGDIVFVVQQPSIYEGQVGIFCVNGSIYIKELGNNELISVNPNHKNIKLNEYDSVVCHGRVTGIANVL